MLFMSTLPTVDVVFPLCVIRVFSDTNLEGGIGHKNFLSYCAYRGSVLFQEMVASKRGNWEESNMILAINKVRNKEMSIRQASDHFSVPKSSLGDRLKVLAAGKEVKLKPCVDNSGTFQKPFTNDQDAELYNHIKALDSQLMPLNKKEFLKLAYNLSLIHI